MKKVLKPIGMALFLFTLAATVAAATKDKNPRGTKSGFITTTDGVKIHYLEAGRQKSFPSAEVGNPLPSGTAATKGNIAVTNPNQFPSILFIPGWTMPAWIWEKQIEYFSKDYRVVAMDPRSQGESSQTHEGLYPAARARDIKAVVDKLHLLPVVLVGWSMGVTEVAAYLDQFGSQDLAGIVLVEGYAGGTRPADAPATLGILDSFLVDRRKAFSNFMSSVMFKKPQSSEYINRVTQASYVTPTDAAVALLVGMHGTDYKPALIKNSKPVLVCAAGNSIFASELEDLHKQIPSARYEVFSDAGHTLFVDDAEKFNALLEDFLHDLMMR
ncbi:MAG: alpha/beta fold hydrolase [Candidatus Acidiferrales bacterium]